MIRSARTTSAFLASIASLLALVALEPAASAQCPGWSDALPGLAGYENPRDVITFDDGLGGGPTLWLAYARNSSADSLFDGGVKRWSGSAWVDVFPSFDWDAITSLAVFDEGAGPRLFGGNQHGVWRLDGATWTQVGPTNLIVNGLEVLDLGSGPELYAFGNDPSGLGSQCIVRRTQNGWASLTQNISFYWAIVRDLVVFDPGSGPALFAAGYLPNPVMQLTPGGWVSIGSPPVGMYFSSQTLLVHDDGSGRALHAAFNYSMEDIAVVARWNGTTWTELPGHFTRPPSLQASILKLVEFAEDAGGTPRLFVGGRFESVGSLPAMNVARWDGQGWTGLGSGVGPGFTQASMLVPLSAAEGGPRLIVGGSFTEAGGLPAYHLATWIGCGGFVGTIVCAGDGSAAACPCGAGGAQRGCPNSVEPLGAQLQAIGTSGLTSDTLRLEGSGMPNAAALYFQGTSIAGGGNGAPFGDGLRCAAGTVVRMGTSLNVLGTSQYPEAGDPPVSQRGQITSPGARTYQVWYRNAAAFCTPATFNLTNGVTVTWSA